MNFGMSALVGVCLFILPGVLFSFGKTVKSEKAPSFGINRDLFTAILISIAGHIGILAVIPHFKSFPPVDYAELYLILTGGGGEKEAVIVAGSVPYFTAYLLALYFSSFILGYFYWFYSRLFLELADEVRHKFHGEVPIRALRVSSGTDMVWSVLDVLTQSGALYRGFYHSSSPGGVFCGEPTLDLMCVSRWSKGRPGAGDDEDKPAKKEGFTNIRSDVPYNEVKAMLRGSDPDEKDPELETMLDKIISDPQELDELLRRLMYDGPEFHILWKDVKNINVRNMDLRAELMMMDDGWAEGGENDHGEKTGVIFFSLLRKIWHW